MYGVRAPVREHPATIEETAVSQSLSAQLEAVRESWNVLRHPFYARWSRGELTERELAFYAGQYRHAVVALADAAERAGSPHAAEEREHVALWDEFAGAVGGATEAAPLLASATPMVCRGWRRRSVGLPGLKI